MTTRQHPLLNGFALTLVTLAVFPCSASAQKQETPTPIVAPAVNVVTEPEAIDPNAPAIAYTGDGGFVPKRLDIEPGTQVRFVNTSDGDFWPASNIHPTHRPDRSTALPKPSSPLGAPRTWNRTSPPSAPLPTTPSSVTSAYTASGMA